MSPNALRSMLADAYSVLLPAVANKCRREAAPSFPVQRVCLPCVTRDISGRFSYALLYYSAVGAFGLLTPSSF